MLLGSGRRTLGKVIRLLPFALVCALALPQPSPAQSSGDRIDALAVISKFADNFCKDVPLEGSSNQVDQLVNDLVKSGTTEATRYLQKNWKGLLQDQLLEARKDNQKCRIQIWTDLSARMLPQSLPRKRSVKVNWLDTVRFPGLSRKAAQMLTVRVTNTDGESFNNLNAEVETAYSEASPASEVSEVLSIRDVAAEMARLEGAAASSGNGSQSERSIEIEITQTSGPNIKRVPPALRDRLWLTGTNRRKVAFPEYLDVNDMSAFAFTPIHMDISNECRLTNLNSWDFNLFCKQLEPGRNVELEFYVETDSFPRPDFDGRISLKVGEFSCKSSSRIDEPSDC